MCQPSTTSPASPASSPPTSSSYSTRVSRLTDTRISHVRSGTHFGLPIPILHDGERQYCVEGLIDVGALGRVAIASILGTSSPVLVAIMVYGKDLTPRQDAMYNNECQIHSLVLSSIPTIGPREMPFVSGLKSSYVPLPYLLVEPITEHLAHAGPGQVRTPQ